MVRIYELSHDPEKTVIYDIGTRNIFLPAIIVSLQKLFGIMDSTRQNKFARLIQKELAGIFTLETKHFFGNAFVTITHVKVTPDLALARVYLSIFKSEKPDEIIEQTRERMHEIRGKLGNRIKSQARHIPELEFFRDDSLDYVEKMENIFKDLHIPPESKEE